MCFPQIVLSQSCGSGKTDGLRERNNNILPKKLKLRYNIARERERKQNKCFIAV